eukprot:2803863-Prymnesium_polylepis.1
MSDAVLRAFAGCGTSITNNCARTEAGRAGQRACRAAFERACRSSSYRRCIVPTHQTYTLRPHAALLLRAPHTPCPSS